MKKRIPSPEAMRKQAEQLLSRADKAEKTADHAKRASLTAKIAELVSTYVGTAWTTHESAPPAWECVKILGFRRDREEPGRIFYEYLKVYVSDHPEDPHMWVSRPNISVWHSPEIEGLDAPLSPTAFDKMFAQISAVGSKLSDQIRATQPPRPRRKKI